MTLRKINVFENVRVCWCNLTYPYFRAFVFEIQIDWQQEFCYNQPENDLFRNIQLSFTDSLHSTCGQSFEMR